MAHLDTGAQQTLFDGEIAETLGINIFSGKKRGGIGSGPAKDCCSDHGLTPLGAIGVGGRRDTSLAVGLTLDRLSTERLTVSRTSGAGRFALGRLGLNVKRLDEGAVPSSGIIGLRPALT